MPVVRLGNTAPTESFKPDESEAKFEKKRLDSDFEVTTYNIPGDYTLAEALQVVAKTYNVHHSDDPPEWVESDSPGLQALLIENFSTEDHEVKAGDPDADNGR